MMYFQISPYCEDNEEIQIFPQGDKFLVGRDFPFFLIAKKSLFSQTSIEYGLLSKSIKMFVQNKDMISWISVLVFNNDASEAM